MKTKTNQGGKLGQVYYNQMQIWNSLFVTKVLIDHSCSDCRSESTDGTFSRSTGRIQLESTSTTRRNYWPKRMAQ